MKHLQAWLAALLLQGCAVPAPPVAAPAPEDATTLAVAGDYPHVPSRFVFPAQLAGFSRLTLMQRGAEGLRITAGYAGGPPQCLVAITLWVDPLADPGATPELARLAERKRLDEAYAVAQREVAQSHPSARLESEESRAEAALPGRRASYRVDDRRLDLIVFVVDKAWLLKYWTIYPAPCAAEAESLITQFFVSWRR